MLLQMVRQNDEKHEEGHKRLRGDWRSHDDELEKHGERLDKIEASQHKLDTRLTDIAATPPDLAKTTLSTGMVVALILAVVGIVGGQIALTRGLSSDIRDINTQLNLRAKADETLQKLQEERSAALKNAVETIGRKQELQQIQLQELRETVLGQQRKAR